MRHAHEVLVPARPFEVHVPDEDFPNPLVQRFECSLVLDDFVGHVANAKQLLGGGILVPQLGTLELSQLWE